MSMKGGEIDVKFARVACRPARVGSALLSFRRISQISLKSWISAQEILRSDVSGFESWTNYETCNQQKTIEEEGCVVYNTLDSKQEKEFSSISFDHPVMAVMDILRFGGQKPVYFQHSC